MIIHVYQDGQEIASVDMSFAPSVGDVLSIGLPPDGQHKRFTVIDRDIQISLVPHKGASHSFFGVVEVRVQSARKAGA